MSSSTGNTAEPKRLVIVESPTKAKTIKRFLPDRGFQIEASMGHVRDLPGSASEIPKSLKDKPWSRIAVDVDDSFEPIYVVPSGKKSIVSKLKAAMREADELYIATDEDREGESIGWHLLKVLDPKIPVRRMVFHEITKEAIMDALENTREIDSHLVEAQETRRVLDRLVGYSISPVLWKKVAPKLSAGRVQSVAVRLLVQREKERILFVPASYWDLKAQLEQGGRNFEAVLTHLAGVRVASGRDFDENTGKLKAGLTEGTDVMLLAEDRAKNLASTLREVPWTISKVEDKIGTRSPAPPFTTSTMQQDASRKLNLSAKQTMQVAQRLYENGLITYMRTDSTNLSKEAIDASRKAVLSRYGNEYLSGEARQYATKSRNAQEAHEAIRPAGTEMKTRDELGLTGIEGALYDLIWKRTVATQMAEARLRFVTATIEAGEGDEKASFRASGRTTEFPGFFRAYVEGNDDPEGALEDREQPLPPLHEGDKPASNEVEAIGHSTKPPARFTEAALIKLLEKEGIGRPSTYASIIDTVMSRGYVRKQNSQLVPTFTAFAVNQLLETQFAQFVDVGFTAGMEQVLDDIARGEITPKPYLKDFYNGEKGLIGLVHEGEKQLDPKEVSTLRYARWEPYVIRVGRFGPYVDAGEVDGEKRTKSLPEDIAPADVTKELLDEFLASTKGADLLADHPETGQPIYVRRGPYGPYVQLGDPDDEGNKPKRVSLPRGLDMAAVDLPTALDLLSLPRNLGEHPETGKKIEAAIGRFGPYVKHGSTFASLPKDDNVLTVGFDRALELITKKEAKNKPLKVLGEHPESGGEVDIREGRYGPYIKYGKMNVGLPKGTDPESVTMDQAVDLIAEKEAKSPKKKTAAKKSTKKAPAKKTAAKKTTAKKSTAKKATAKKPAAKKTTTKTKSE